ncbi:hypothetical protein AB0O18_29925 [Streptomyces sp. NPDC093224]|uniref:hypothetical protein n=1 Tax=Streptomyces sp. NPDC093224 TaxID=3155198 RepID=UPI00341887A5
MNSNNAEEAAVYAGLLRRLSAGLVRAPVLVDREYGIDAEGTTAEARDNGFVPGRSAVRIRAMPDLAGVRLDVP